ncbi:CheC domain-containing protein [Desulfonema magnum]|uniref:CheC domain-containing protein n=2 Tax=Desulfonema magnum TaxID=45655 RepID=A0A975BKE0_9BACT|nr:CheC domain-containing protein [Desulfonema magnum]
MNTDSSHIFSDEEKDILQEIMNIAFGNATADLGEVIDIYVELSAPSIQILGIGDIPDYLTDRMKLHPETSIVAQNFWGDFKGYGILVLPNRTGRSLIAILDDGEPNDFEMKPIAGQEREVLMEVGNILIGACVGKVCELLNTFVTYTPPQVIHENSNEYSSFVDSFDPSQTAILMETVFRFKAIDINGLLLVITSQEAIEWLRKALYEFMEPYE